MRWLIIYSIHYAPIESLLGISSAYSALQDNFLLTDFEGVGLHGPGGIVLQCVEYINNMHIVVFPPTVGNI